MSRASSTPNERGGLLKRAREESVLDALLLEKSSSATSSAHPALASSAQDAHASPDLGSVVLPSQEPQASRVIYATLMIDSLLVAAEDDKGALCHAKAQINALLLCGSPDAACCGTQPLRDWMVHLSKEFARSDRPITFAQQQACRNLMALEQSPLITESSSLAFGNNEDLSARSPMYKSAAVVHSEIGEHEGIIVRSAARVLDTVEQGASLLAMLCKGEVSNVSLDELHTGRDGLVQWLGALCVATSMENLQLRAGSLFSHAAFSTRMFGEDGSVTAVPVVPSGKDALVWPSGFGASYSFDMFNSSQDKLAVEHAFRALAIILTACEEGIEYLKLDPGLQHSCQAYQRSLQQEFDALFASWKAKHQQDPPQKHLSSSMLTELHGIATRFLEQSRVKPEAAAALHAVLLGKVFVCGLEAAPEDGKKKCKPTADSGGAAAPGLRCGSAQFKHGYVAFVNQKGLSDKERKLSFLDAMEFLTGTAGALGSPARVQMVVASVWAGTLAELHCSSRNHASRPLLNRSPIWHMCNGPVVLDRTCAAALQSRYFDNTGQNKRETTLSMILGAPSKTVGKGRREGHMNVAKEERLVASYTSGAYSQPPEVGPAAARVAAKQVVGLHHLVVREGARGEADGVPSQNSRSFDALLAESVLSYPATYFFVSKAEFPLSAIATAIGPFRALFHSAAREELVNVHQSKRSVIELKVQELTEPLRVSGHRPTPVPIPSKDYSRCTATTMHKVAETLFDVELLNQKMRQNYFGLSSRHHKRLCRSFEQAKAYGQKWACLLKTQAGLTVEIDTLNEQHRHTKLTLDAAGTTSAGTPQSVSQLECEIECEPELLRHPEEQKKVDSYIATYLRN